MSPNRQQSDSREENTMNKALALVTEREHSAVFQPNAGPRSFLKGNVSLPDNLNPYASSYKGC
jgi:hypothetical protein